MVDEQEADVRVAPLGLGQIGHFDAARAAPAGPEIDHHRPDPRRLRERGGLRILQRHQCDFGVAHGRGALLHQQAHAPDREPDRRTRGQRGPQGGRAPGQAGQPAQAGRQADPQVPAAVADVDHRGRAVGVGLPVQAQMPQPGCEQAQQHGRGDGVARGNATRPRRVGRRRCGIARNRIGAVGDRRPGLVAGHPFGHHRRQHAGDQQQHGAHRQGNRAD